MELYQISVVNIFEIFWFFAYLSGFYFLAKKKTVFESALFFIPAFIWGYFIEFFGLRLYDLYYYPERYILSFEGVPISIAAGWAVLTFFGYYITSNRLHVVNKLKLFSESAVISTIIDFIILEPLAFFMRLWIWTENDFWFGAPLFNFVGWLFAISIFLVVYNYTISNAKNRLEKIGFITLGCIIGMTLLQVIGLGYIYFFGA